MDAPIPVGADIDQDQNEGEEEESKGLATREAKELIMQLFQQRTSDNNAKNTSARSARRSMGVEKL